VGGAILETCCLQIFFVCRCKNTGDRTPDSGSGEVGETATPAFAANDGPETTRRTVRVCRVLKREKKSACVFLYVGGVKVFKKIREYEMGAYELLEFLIVSHEEGRYELACPPPVDVRRGHRRAGPEVLGDVLEAEVLLNVLLPLFFLPPRAGVGL
jgi:hypothetical protein